MKICVTGYSGAGKSTLAKILGKKYNLPVLHLDATFWFGNWQHRTREEQANIVRSFMKENSQGWVTDGNYFHISLERFEECDRAYFLNYNRFFCFNSALKRYKMFKGAVRADCPCEEKFDFEFAFWILFKGRTRRQRLLFKNNLRTCKGEILVFKSRKKLNKYLTEL